MFAMPAGGAAERQADQRHVAEAGGDQREVDRLPIRSSLVLSCQLAQLHPGGRPHSSSYPDVPLAVGRRVLRPGDSMLMSCLVHETRRISPGRRAASIRWVATFD